LPANPSEAAINAASPSVVAFAPLPPTAVLESVLLGVLLALADAACAHGLRISLSGLSSRAAAAAA
jgi:hypothetical protein